MRRQQKSISLRFEEKVYPDPNSGCWLWGGGNNRWGYGIIGRGTRKEGVVKAHRLSWELSCGPIPAGLHVLHKCDNTYCVNPAHLFLGTARSNSDDKIAKGRYRQRGLQGAAHPAAKLKDEDVLAIRADLGSTRSIAELYQLDLSTVRDIRNRKTWRHI